ncbi:hypothetical protein FOA52_014428 [Chlamydomonas sp. UWO 241]|nr:hypothetical protein FOA52_014428 [Chlamydomonas sp. UWO 241]
MARRASAAPHGNIAASCPSATLRCPLVRAPSTSAPMCPLVRGSLVAAHASKDQDMVKTVLSTGNKLIDTVSDWVPESVPRPVARGGVAVLGALFVFGLIQKVISGFVTLFVLLGIGYFYITRNGDDDDTDKPPKARSSADELDDPLSDARRIMDKYK